MSVTSANPITSVSDLLSKAEKLKYSDRDQSFKLTQEALPLAESNGLKEHLLHALMLVAYSYHHRAQPELFFKTIERVLDLADETGDLKNKAYACFLCACNYRNLGDFSSSAEKFLESLSIAEKAGETETMIRTLNGLGHLYCSLGDMTKALESFDKGHSLLKEIDNPQLFANLLGNQAEVFTELKRFDEAKANLNYVAKIHEELNDTGGLGVTRFRLGKLHYALNEIDECFEIFSDLYKFTVDIDFKIGITVVAGEFARVLAEQGRYEDAIPYLDTALKISAEINYHNNEHELYYLKYKIASWKEDYKSALNYFELYHELKEKTYTKEAELKLKNAESLSEIQLVKKDAELNRLKHVELRKAYEEIEIKNTEITDSIRYARRIQSAILPDHSLVKESFPDSFILFQPRNIVSGDFYYFQSAIQGNHNLKLIVVADCTGHGVPGALMSMIGSSLLNQVIIAKGISEPSQILEELDRDLSIALKSGKGETRDGMDITVALYDESTRKLSVSSAMRPVFVYNSVTGNLDEIPGTKRSIGGHAGSVSFKTNHTTLNPRDRFYLFSDGYADQFGGAKGKKLMLKNFKSNILSSSTLPVDEQSDKLLEFFETWKGDLEQVDDVTLLCLQVK